MSPLLALVRSHRIDLARIALPALVDQLIAALRDASGRTPLGLRADWVVMAAWLLQLRSRLLLPAQARASDAANREAAQVIALPGHAAASCLACCQIAEHCRNAP